MTRASSVGALPLALIAGEREGPTGPVEQLLTTRGFAALRVPTAALALARARTTRPDLAVVDGGLADMSASEVCAALLQEAPLGAAVPIVVAWDRAPSHDETLAVLRAGAWDSVGPARDPEDLALRLGTYVRSKLAADRARAEGLLDHVTGLYNAQGLARRARELESQAFRQHGAIACVVVSLDLAPDAAASGDRMAATVVRCVHALRSLARMSDAVGRLGPTEFALIAPGTDATGAKRLAERVTAALKEAGTAGGDAASQVRVAFDAVANVTYGPVAPVDLLSRASAAIRRGRPGPAAAGG